MIRRARRSDLGEMRRVFLVAGQAAWPHIIPPEELARNEPPSRWRGAVETSDGRTAVFVAEHEGDVVGFAILRPSGDEDAVATVGELDGLYTHSSVWGQGFGRALLDEALAFAREVGFREATLWTAEANHRPRRIYERGGWRLDGGRRERVHLGASFVELRYRLSL
jgi:GNAT superfamily N-acetyltransferase